MTAIGINAVKKNAVTGENEVRLGLKRFGRGALPCAGAFLLMTLAAGCGMSNITSGLGSGGIFGPKKTENAWAPVTEEGMLTAAKNEGGPVEMTPPGSVCPAFAPSGPEKIITVYEGGHLNDSLSVMHRGEITKTARECDAGPGGISVKYGVGGRVLLGPKGRGGIITLPLVVTVMDKARNRIKSDPVKIQVQVSPDDPVGYFSVVRVITFPMAPGSTPQDYKLYVAFDRNIPGAG